MTEPDLFKLPEEMQIALLLTFIVISEVSGKPVAHVGAKTVADAIYTGLYALEQADRGSKKARKFIDMILMGIPETWGKPDLVQHYKDLPLIPELELITAEKN